MRSPLFLPTLLLALSACSHQAPDAVTVGILHPGSTMKIVASQASVNVYKPAAGDPPGRFTVAVYGAPGAPPPPSPTITKAGNGILVGVPGAVASLLIRVPEGVNVAVELTRGNVTVYDISGSTDVRVGTGDVRISTGSPARIVTQNGTIDATLTQTAWNGTSSFFAGQGDVNVSVSTVARFHARLHTDGGSTFTDFDLRGTSSGASETIDGLVNGGAPPGAPAGVDIETHRGSVRLLKLAPQG